VQAIHAVHNAAHTSVRITSATNGFSSVVPHERRQEESLTSPLKRLHEKKKLS